MSEKIYVVWAGRQPGIYHTWEECKQQISGWNGARFKAYDSLKEAEIAYKLDPDDLNLVMVKGVVMTKKELREIGEPNLQSISVDAACSGNPGRMEYRGVDTATKKVIFHGGPYQNSTNNIGEFLALVHGLAYMVKINDTRPVYSDSQTAMTWVRNKEVYSSIDWSNKSMQVVNRAIKWLHNVEYPNEILKWHTKIWGEIPADFGRK